MHAIWMIDGLWTVIALLFLLGALRPILAQLRERKGFGITVVLEAAIVGSMFAICGILLILVAGMTLRKELAGSDLLSLLGLIVTVITGVTIALAFRALDQAKGASKIVYDATAQLDSRMAATTLSLSRLSAYVEAQERLRQAREVPGMRRQELLRIELVRLFVSNDITQLMAHARTLLWRSDIFKELGPIGRSFFDSLDAHHEFSPADRRTIRNIRGLID